MSSRIRACLFDLYDTLVYFDEDGYRKKNNRLAEICGTEPDVFARAWRSLVVESNCGAFADTAARALRVQQLVGRSPDVDVADQIASEEQRFLREESILFPEAAGVLSTLHEAGVRLAIVTNASPSVWQAINAQGLGRWFECIVVSCELGVRKPDPRIYGEALSRLQVTAGESVFIGDGNDKELDGAKRVGMATMLIDRRMFKAVTTCQSSPGDIDVTGDSLWEVPVFLGLSDHRSQS